MHITPVVSLFDTRVGGTRSKVVTKRVYLKLPPTTSRKWFLSNDRDLVAHGHDKESLSETSRPDFISTVRTERWLLRVVVSVVLTVHRDASPET